MLVSLAKRVIGSFGSRLPLEAKQQLLDAALWRMEEVTYGRLRRDGFSPAAIIDVGAYRGEWSRGVRKIFPNAPILMVEARQDELPHLKRACAEIPPAEHAIALLSSTREVLDFNIQGTGSSIFAERSDTPRERTRAQAITLDEVIAEHPGVAKGPLFLKLDVQGAELAVLRGGKHAISLAEVVQVETSLLPYNEGAPTFAEVVGFMDAEGFSAYEIASFVRPFGGDLVALDIIFTAKTSKLRRDYFVFGSRVAPS